MTEDHRITGCAVYIHASGYGDITETYYLDVVLDRPTGERVGTCQGYQAARTLRVFPFSLSN